MTKTVPRVHIGKMHFDKRDIDGQQGISQRNAGVSERCRIKNNEINAEYELIDRIHLARPEGINFIIFNPAAFTHAE